MIIGSLGFFAGLSVGLCLTLWVVLSGKALKL